MGWTVALRAVNRFGKSALLVSAALAAAMLLPPSARRADAFETLVSPDDLAREPRLDPRLASVLAAGTDPIAKDRLIPEGHYGVPLVIRGAISRESLEAVGAVVETQAGRVSTVEAPPEAIASLLALPGVEGIEAPTRVDHFLDRSAVEIGADVMWGDRVPPYQPPYSGTTGAGVVVGIVDTGIDFTHPDFKKSNNQTRVKYLWDQTRVGTQPSGFTYGAEWTESQINAGTPTEEDTDGHGTHIAGIAAGNGRATGGGFPAYRYVGIAPEADLVVVKSYPSDDRVIDGVNYVFQKAGAMGKDAVVVLAVGHQRGAHDGSYYFDTAISALTGPGRIVVAAAGNYAGKSIHAVLDLASGATGTINFRVPVAIQNPTINEYVEIEGWHNPTASFKVKLTSPSGYTTNWINPGASSTTLITTDGAFFVQNAMETSSKGGKKVRVYLYETGGVLPRTGTWRIDAQRLSGTTTGLLDAWVSDWYLDSGTDSLRFTSNVNLTKLIPSPATADSVIAVGAYVTKTEWTNATGALSFYVGAPLVGAIADFSSPGPRRDGVQRPDLAAPGYGVMAALAAEVAGRTSNTWIAEDGVHRILRGTSQAAAHAAGAVALLLDNQPDLKPGGARALLLQNAKADAFTGSVPNATWGKGKLRLPGGSLTPVESMLVDTPRLALAAFPNPTKGRITFEFALAPGEISAAGEAPRLRIIDVEGRQVALLAGSAALGVQRLSWDGHSTDGKSVGPGVYFARLEVGNSIAVEKFVRLR
jgi:subtilisin family serine protease